jgi:hypothetical protein
MTTIVRAKAFDLATVQKLADWLAIGVAVSLPWSTSATGILIVLWLVVVLPTLSLETVRREVFTAAGGLPVLLWLLAALGMFWADVGWHERFNGLDGFHRLLVIPVLLAQFRRSQHGAQVLYGFLVSAICLLAASWAFVLIRALGVHGKSPGVPVKDYLFQSSIFIVCAFAGIVGAALLIAMWTAHLMLFRGDGLVAWIGLLIVIQNVVSSLANLHLFDFSHGWLYVFGVGVAGGMVLCERDVASSAERVAPS